MPCVGEPGVENGGKYPEVGGEGVGDEGVPGGEETEETALGVNTQRLELGRERSVTEEQMVQDSTAQDSKALVVNMNRLELRPPWWV